MTQVKLPERGKTDQAQHDSKAQPCSVVAEIPRLWRKNQLVLSPFQQKPLRLTMPLPGRKKIKKSKPPNLQWDLHPAFWSTARQAAMMT